MKIKEKIKGKASSAADAVRSSRLAQRFSTDGMSVRNRIFYSNTAMILVTIVVCLLIGVMCAGIFWEKEEEILHQVVGGRMASREAERLIADITVHNEVFITMAVLFALLSIITLIVVSLIFTGLLTRKIMKPLDLLEEGADRIRNNDLTEPIQYHGDAEFQRVCEAFNAMELHLKEEKEKNAKYEKSRQEMIAGISHDLRSPLTAIRGSVKGLMDGVVIDPEEQKKFLQAAYRRSGEMDQLLTELFFFSKMETGGIPVNMTTIDLGEYLKNFFQAKREQPDTSDIDFSLELPEDTEAVAQCDPEALQRILDNVLNNSRKYAGASPFRFRVLLRERPEKWVMVLQDNGKGVSDDKLHRIFEEFYRVDESRNKEEGSGLGLYIVKYLTEEMGGRVYATREFDSEEFKGLAVAVELKKGGPNGRTEQ